MKKLFNQVKPKRLICGLLCLCMVMTLMPMTANAVTSQDLWTSTNTTFYFDSSSQSGDNTNTLHYTVTDPGASINNIRFSTYTNRARIDLSTESGWYFKGWETYFSGWEDVKILSDPEVSGSNPYDGESYMFHNTDGNWNPYVNQEGVYSRTSGSYAYLFITNSRKYYGDFYVTAVLKPIVTVNADTGISYQIITDNPSTGNGLSANQVAVKYGENTTVTYIVDEKYEVTKVSVNDGTNYSKSETENEKIVTVNAVKQPTTITIDTILKRQQVFFVANGGSGSMSVQSFEHSVAKTLTANAFTRTGYIFAGWNTEADGSGTGYSDKQSVSFTPANDGDSITLYAQWTQCTNHQWDDGKCTECGALCSHSGGNATCTEQATCSTCGEKYGELAKHTLVYNGSNNRIVETCTVDCGHTATADLVRDENISTVYSGTAVNALKANYSDNWQGDDLEIAYADNTNVGTASGTISIDGATATQTFEISAATMTNVSAQGYSSIYDGQAHGITVNAPAGATVSYKVGNGEYSTENPTFKDAGTYTVTYKVSMTNYADVVGTAEVNIDKAPLTVTAKDHSIKYGENPANNGVSYSGFVANETESVLGSTLGFDYTYTKGNNVGTYEITPKGLTSNNYEITFAKGTLTVEKADATCTAPTANELTYTGSALNLIDAGSTADGKLVYSLTENGDFTESIPTGENAGKYTVWYKVIGDDNHNDTAPASITVEIKKATPDLGTVSVDGAVYDTTKPEDVVLTQSGTVSGVFKITDAAMLANKTAYNYTFTPSDTANYNSVTGQVTIDVQDTVAPTASISIDEHKWTILDTITFGLFYNESKEVTITAADNENGSGLKDILYFVSDKELSGDDLAGATWKSYTDAFDIDPDGKYVVYAKVVDNDGNALTINSNGLLIDKTQAVVEGLTNGGTYYGQLVFTVADELAGVKSVVIDDNDETNFEGQYVISGDNAEHTIVVTNNAGNVTEYKVTVFKNYTVTYKADGKPVSTETVGHGKDATLPAVPAKDGYTGKWDHDGKNITSDIVINAVYTEISAPAPSDPQSPQTGDNSNMFLWIALLFISGGAVIALTVVDRKRRNIAE